MNDAAMQALGAYDDGRMLFLGLGTGLGSTLVVERVIVPLELGELPWRSGGTLGNELGRTGFDRDGVETWRDRVVAAAKCLRSVFRADYVVLGGGNAEHVDSLPSDMRRGKNQDAIIGGDRIWREVVEPHDRQPSPFWRVVR